MLLVVLLIFNKKKIFVPLRYTTCFNSYRFMCAHRLTLTNPRLHTTFSSYFYFYPLTFTLLSLLPIQKFLSRKL